MVKRLAVHGAARLGKRASARPVSLGDIAVSIIRVGLAETKKFSEGYEAIFGKKKESAQDRAGKSPAKKKKVKKKK